MINPAKYPNHLLKLIDVLKKLPGVGSKSAERFAFEMISWPENRLREMAKIIEAVPAQMHHCPHCGCLTEESCRFCKTNEKAHSICVVAKAKDVFSIGATNEYQGLYHVLGTLLSPMDGIGPDRLHIEKLLERIQLHEIKEVIIALDSTLEGDATSLYLKSLLSPLNIKISRLAFGLPMGSSLDYVDGGTLARAFNARSHY